jgi:hypothetical protein
MAIDYAGIKSSQCSASIRNSLTMRHVIVWDIETVPDLRGFAAANGHDGKSDDEIRAELGDKFPKHIYHPIICIGVSDVVQLLSRLATLRAMSRLLKNAFDWDAHAFVWDSWQTPTHRVPQH